MKSIEQGDQTADGMFYTFGETLSTARQVYIDALGKVDEIYFHWISFDAIYRTVIPW